jgi:hypothetical protein
VALRFALRARARSAALVGALKAQVMATPWPLILLLRSLGAKGEPWMRPIWALTQGSHNLCDHTPGLGWPIVRQGATLAAAAASPPQVQRVMRFYY